MTLFLWKKSYEINIAEVDVQHRRLVGMINELSDAMMVRKGQRSVPHILEELGEYVQFHFSSEEKVMAEFNYPGIDEHIQEHQDFSKKVKEFMELYAQDHELDTRELLQFLCDWLKNHIVVNDKDIAKHIRRVEMGVG